MAPCGRKRSVEEARGCEDASGSADEVATGEVGGDEMGDGEGENEARRRRDRGRGGKKSKQSRQARRAAANSQS